MITLPFSQVDVFAPGPLPGNPVAVVHEADALSDQQMQTFANWTNLSETTFLLAPTDPAADYRLRIFTTEAELPFAGHPTLGSAHAWLEHGGSPKDPERVVQECAAGLITLRRGAQDLAFAAPPLVRSGPLDPAVLAQATASLRLEPAQVVDSSWIDNGPGWLGLRLDSAETVLGLRPDVAAMGDLAVAVIGPHAAGGPADYEVRVFAPGHGLVEDPVTGSANAGFAVWFDSLGLARRYTARQGTALGRGGLVTVEPDEAGTSWVGGPTRTVITGVVHFEGGPGPG